MFKPNGLLHSLKNKVESDVHKAKDHFDQLLPGIQDQLKGLERATKNIQQMDIPFEEKIKELSKALEPLEIIIPKFLKSLRQVEYNDLVWGGEDVNVTFDYDEDLHKTTKLFLETAGVLYRVMNSTTNDEELYDFSPITIEYCKAFENEIYEKLFIPIRSIEMNLHKSEHEKKDEEKMIKAKSTPDQSLECLTRFHEFVYPFAGKGKKIALGDMRNIVSVVLNSNIHEIPIVKQLDDHIIREYRAITMNNFTISSYINGAISKKDNQRFIDAYTAILHDRNDSAHRSVQNVTLASCCRENVLATLRLIYSRKNVS